MSNAELALVMNGLGRTAPGKVPVLRVVLLSGDALRIPRLSSHLRVLTGTAWVSQGGKDRIIEAGQCYKVPAGRDRPIVSGLRGEPLLVEMR